MLQHRQPFGSSSTSSDIAAVGSSADETLIVFAAMSA